MNYDFIPKALILDFDGVFTDNKVLTNSEGIESVNCSKLDSLALSNFRDSNPFFKIVVISSEGNESISYRCKKLKLDLIKSVKSKFKAASKWTKSENIKLSDCIFLCNDTNDIELCKNVGFPIGVKDSNPLIYDYILSKTNTKGGQGAIAEVLDLISKIINKQEFKSLSPEDPINESLGKRDWGEETLLFLSKGHYIMKKLFIKKGFKGGLQRHHLKDESAYIISGSLMIRYDCGDGKLTERILNTGESIRFKPGCVHQEEAIEDTLIIECSSPHFNDRIREEDRYHLPNKTEGLPSTFIYEIKSNFKKV